MIRDTGILSLYHRADETASGNMPGNAMTEYYSAWYGERTVGMSRYFTAQQMNTKIDKLVRIGRPSGDIVIKVDDVAVLSDGYRYRIVQSQELFDDEAGEDVIDLSLERIGYRDGNNT